MSEWLQFKLSEICEIFDGPHATPPKVSNGHVFLGISSINYDGRIDSSCFEYVDEEHYQKWTRRITPRCDDIVFSYETKLGTAAIIPSNFICCLGRRMGLLRCNNLVHAKFLLYYYLSPEFQGVIQERTYSGSTVDRIPLKEMGAFPVHLPTLPEQKAIASVLSSLDDKIDLLHRQNKTLEAMAETLFRQWFIDEAKEDWEDGILSDIASNVRVNASTESIEPHEIYIGLEHIERRNIALSQHGFGSDVSSNKSRFKKNDILFGKLRPYFHKVCIAPFDGICSTDILVLRAREEIWTAFTLFAFFQDSVVEYANLASGGTRMPRADWGAMSQYPIAIPPMDLVGQFNDLVLPSIEKIHANLVQIQTLENLRDTLLPKLMSGEVRVPYQTEQVA